MNIKIDIPKNPGIAVNMLLAAGFETGVVGGCTRDAIMGEIPNDWDVCTSATPSEIQKVFKNFKQLTMGLKHGTVVVIINGEGIEITTYRIDGDYSDGRRPDQVSFTKNLVEDLSRRDYTHNAMFYNETQGLVDPFNGISDIQNKTVRCVGNPDKRLIEDSLRILRGIRFASKLGFNVEASTKKAMFKNMKLLKNVSKERITVEFTKLLCGKNAMHVLDEFKEIIAYIIPELKNTIGFNQHNPYHIYDIWTHTIVTVNNVDGLMLKLAMFFHDIGKPNCYTVDDKGIGHFYGHADISAEITSEIFKRMRITNADEINKNDIKDILELIKFHDVMIKPTKKSIRKWLSKLNGRQIQFQRLLKIKRADILAQVPEKQKERLIELDNIQTLLNKIIEENACTTLKDLAITGKDLIILGIPCGKQIGQILNTLLKDVVNETLPNKRDSLLKAVQKIKSNL